MLFEQGPERAAPTLGQRRYRKGAAKAGGRVPGQVEQRADLANTHRLRPHGDALDDVARAHLALLEHAQVEPGPSVRVEQRGHARLLQAQTDLEAGSPAAA